MPDQFAELDIHNFGQGETAPLPALGIPPTDESHFKTFERGAL